MKLGSITVETFKSILLDKKYLTKEDLAIGEKISSERGIELADAIIYENLSTKHLMGEAIAEFYDVSFAGAETSRTLSKDLLFPEEFAKKWRTMLLKFNEKEVYAVTDDPSQSGLKDEVKKAVFELRLEAQQQEALKGSENKVSLPDDPEIILVYTLPETMDEFLLTYKKSLDSSFVQIIKNEKRVAPEIIDHILEDALNKKTSDIHFEPLHETFVIRFRIDGVLEEAGSLPIDHYEYVLNSIKLASNLRVDEHNAIQDGAIRWNKNGVKVDVRVSIAPTAQGEVVVMRLLAHYISTLSLESLGLSKLDQSIIEDEIKKPFGMVLAAGPTGSGKTTTMYAALQILNTTDRKIITIEDPVEYKMDHLSQIQVNLQTGITFARGLRSIVRQDPDTILVGEIRDEETADLAVNAALTGHLLFSTLHANDASSAITRFLEMGIVPFMLSSMLNVIIAQRLVRKICMSCMASVTLSKKDLDAIVPGIGRIVSPKGEFKCFQGKGCDACHHTGYRGRTSIIEIIRVSPAIRDLILKNPSAIEVWRLAKKEGSNSLFADGLEKVKSGVTTISELLRVARPPAE